MRLRLVIAENLRTLMAASKLDTLPKITAASRDRLTNGTLDRMRRGIGDARIDKLEELADVFRVEPWVLTIPGISAEQGIDGFPIIQMDSPALFEGQQIHENPKNEGLPPATVQTVTPKLGLHVNKASQLPDAVRAKMTRQGASRESGKSARKKAPGGDRVS